MERIIRAIKKEEWETCLDFVERVFTDSEDAESGRLVRNLMTEIRSNRYYVPELDLVMLNREGEIIGQTMFSRFHLEGRYEDELIILTPVAVKTELQRQHISKELIEFGLNRARELGFTVCIVEGDPQNYRPRGFRTSADYGIFADESVGLPHPDCLMVQELVPGALKNIEGCLNYSFYESLR